MPDDAAARVAQIREAWRAWNFGERYALPAWTSRDLGLICAALTIAERERDEARVLWGEQQTEISRLAAKLYAAETRAIRLAALEAAARGVDTCSVCQGHGVVYRAVDDGDVTGDECDCRVALSEALAALAAADGASSPPARQWQAIRPDDTGAVDDVAITGDLFRLERMGRGAWWSCIYRGDQRTAFRLRVAKGDIVVTVAEDSIGCVDDRTTLEVNRADGSEAHHARDLE